MDFEIFLEYTFSQFQDKNISLTVRIKIYSHVHINAYCFERGVNCCIDRFDNVIKQLVYASAVRMSRY